MAQLSQMTRYVTSVLGWLPAATASSDCSPPSSAKNQEEDALQESSGFVTVMAIYLAITIVLVAVSFITAKDQATKYPNRLKTKRKITRPQEQQQQQRPWRFSTTGMAMTKLIRQLGSPKRSRHQMRLRLRMRLRRHLEQELKLMRELQEKGPQLGLLGSQDFEEVNNSGYFDPSSEADL
ncbi:uncharacterized protein [Drosophila kikkawai]|uniref:Uncharacterized protein n=1 Tax=Drosophila kikkawai TaxID=30033 RepID=A0A6P4JLE7_DROKI|nr:uncharacterized protein LOC108084660 [Drosophila kikkawai]